MKRRQYIALALAILTIATALFKLSDDNPTKKDSVIYGRVAKVKDGDTVSINPDSGGRSFTCRLYGIDTPEKSGRGVSGQPYWEQAARELEELAGDQTVRITLTGEKSYNREICLIDRGGVNVNLEMVKRGYAWAYRRYLDTPYAGEYIYAEEGARGRRLGLWRQTNPEPPWEFRRRER